MSDTPRTDAVALHRDVFRRNGNEGDILTDFARTLERELAAERERTEKAEAALADTQAAMTGLAMTMDEQKNADYSRKYDSLMLVIAGIADGQLKNSEFAPEGPLRRLCERLEKAERERDAARAALADWNDGAKSAMEQRGDEVHCSCVPALAGQVRELERQRDNADRTRDNAIREVMRASADAAKAERERDAARAALRECLTIIHRYLRETPVGHQPHMIVAEAERVVARASKAAGAEAVKP